MTLPPLVLVFSPVGESQAVRSRAPETAANSRARIVNRRSNVPRWGGGGGTFTDDERFHCIGPPMNLMLWIIARLLRCVQVFSGFSGKFFT